MFFCSLLLLSIFGIFIFRHQKQLSVEELARVRDHAKVISVSLWTYEVQTPTDYLRLASKANHYQRVIVTDEYDNVFLDIEGEPFTKPETFFHGLKLLHIHRLHAPIAFGERQIGTITVEWLCRALFLYFYIFFCIFLMLTGLFLFLKLLEANRLLEKRVNQRTRALETEIQERKRTQEELQQQTQRLSMHVRHTPLGVVEWSADFKVVEWNRAAEKIFGYSRKEMLGRMPFGRILPEEEEENIKKVWAKLIANTGGTRHVNINTNKNGDLRTCAWHNTTITDDDKNVIGVGSLVMDITEQVEAEKKNQLLQEQLLQAQKMEAVGNLAGGISHDFNNLLQSISGYTQLLLLECEKNNGDCRRLKGIEKAAHRAAELVRQLLTFSRKIESNLVVLSLNHEIEQVRAMLGRTIPKMVAIEMDLAPDLYDIKGDTVQIEQILLNLAINANHAMPEGGKLSISTRNTYLSNYYCTSHLGAQPGWNVSLQVMDTGVGMDQATLDRIFEPFFTTKEIGKGTGLGLASVYGIVVEHRAYIECTSEVGRGTVFTIHFPAVIDETKGSPLINGDRLETIPRGGETVLLVDDEETIRDIGQQMLKDFGYTPVTAASGEEALQLFCRKQKEIDLVVMDLNMPGMGGYKCMETMKGLNADLPIIVASGYTPAESVVKCSEAGADGFISKPYNISEFLLNIRETLDAGK